MLEEDWPVLLLVDIPIAGDIGRNMRSLYFRGAIVAAGWCLGLAAVSPRTDVCRHGHGVDAEKLNDNGIPLSILTSDRVVSIVMRKYVLHILILTKCSSFPCVLPHPYLQAQVVYLSVTKK